MSQLLALFVVAATVAACSGHSGTTGTSSGGSSMTTPSPALPTSATGADLAFCIQETNRYRAMARVAAVARSATIEQYAAQAARSDGLSHTPHGYSTGNNGGNGTVFAENEVPWWPLAQFATVQAVMQSGIASFWNEGPTGGHYRNLTGAYSQAGCGVFISNGEITVVQDLR